MVLLSPFGIGSELKIDHQRILEIAQGHRSIDTLQLLDPSKANWECEFGILDPSRFYS